VLAAVLTACVGPVSSLYPPDDPALAKPAYVVSLGWHTRLAVRRADVPVDVWPERQEFGDVEYLEVGWGDRAFYQADDPTSGMAVRAAFGTPAVLHVAGLPELCAARAGLAIVRIEVSPHGFERLLRVIHDSYERDAYGRPLPTRRGYDPLSRFYLATGRYHVFHTSNTWVAETLRAAGVPVTPALSFLAATLMAQARRVGTAACK
jgi:uncharacterized protein (TIGR02117 family)